METAMDTITDTAEKVSRKARRAARSTAKDLKKTAKRTTKSARGTAKRATKKARGTADDLLAAATGTKRQRRRRWPWLVGMAAMAAAAGTAYAMRGKPQTEPVQETPSEADTNGVTPHPRREQQVDSSANHR